MTWKGCAWSFSDFPAPPWTTSSEGGSADLCVLRNVRWAERLTWDERNSLELFEPAFRYFDDLFFHLLAFSCISLIVGEIANGAHIGLANGIEDVEHVFSVWDTALRKFRRHVVHELLVLLKFGPERFNWQLVVERNVPPLHVWQFEEAFSFHEDVPQEVFVQHGVWRHV